MARRENEPNLPDCLGTDSLVFAPTTGMRLAPEVLVFELFRELGYGDARHEEETSARELAEAIETQSVSPRERLLLATCRGRFRRGGRAFYAPPYPGLARHGWLRKRTDRTMRDYFLGGPLAHHYESAGGELDCELVVRALLGHHSAHAADDCSGKELLSLIAIEQREDPSPGQLAQNLETLLRPRSAPLRPHEDATAQLMATDFLELCRLEEAIPRREWLFFLIAFVRVSTAAWLLAHLRITVSVRDWLLAACLGGRDRTTTEEMLSDLRRRHEGIFHPTSSPSREVFEHVEDFMRARVELRLLVNEIVEREPAAFQSSDGSKRILSLDREGAGFVTAANLLTLARAVNWAEVTQGAPLSQWLTRSAEKWPAWRSPRKRGQGKNIDEFLRVLYHSPDDDSGSGLLIRSRRPYSTTTIVPGHRVLQLFSFLAARRKARSRGRREKGKLVLRDLETHFFDYGIDFRSSSFGRPLLIEKLMEGGLLEGSPDAGESAQVLNPIGRVVSAT